MPGMNLGLGLGLSSVIGAIKKWFQADSYKADSVSPSLILDFANDRYAAKSVRTNYVYNSTFTGVVDINIPNMRWDTFQGGITREYIGTGTEDGMSYIDLRYRGTATNTNTHTLFFNDLTSGYPDAVIGQIWTGSVYAKIVGGSKTNVEKIAVMVAEYSSTPTYLTTSSSDATSTLDATLRRIQHTRTLSNASTAKVVGGFSVRAVNGTAIDITIRLYAPQFEMRSVATSYIPTSTGAVTVSSYEAKPFSDILTFSRASTATYFDANGVMQTAAINARRIDHDPLTGEKRGLLIEGARTNYIMNSELFNNWTVNTMATVSVNTDTAPDGTLTMDTVNMAASIYSGVYRFDLAAAVSTSYCFSMFVKNKSGGKKIKFGCDGSGPFGTSTAALAIFDTETLTFSSVGSAVTSYGYTDVGGGIYRIYVVATSTASASGNVTTPIFNGDGTGVASFAVWGYQLEIGSFPSSYIPTSGSAVTRSADYVVNTGSNNVPFASWYNQSEGTILITSRQKYADTGGSFPSILNIYDGTANENLRIQQKYGLEGYRFNVQDGGVTQANLDATLTVTSEHKLAAAYKVNDFSCSFDGSGVVTDASGTIPTTDRLALGDNKMYGYIKEIRYYNQRITNSELQRITT